MNTQTRTDSDRARLLAVLRKAQATRADAQLANDHTGMQRVQALRARIMAAASRGIDVKAVISAAMA